MTKVEKKWNILSGWRGKGFSGLPKWLLSILANRGIKSEQEISSFLEPKYENLVSPFVFKNMPESMERIKQALSNQEKVTIYGDYDVDGVTSTALLFELLSKIGFSNVEKYIPHREEEGYGLHDEAVSDIIKKGSRLIISVDCGITSKEIIDKWAQKADFIVIDHHEILEEKVPKKALILHPQLLIGPLNRKGRSSGCHPVQGDTLQGGYQLSACGMAFFLAKAVFESEKFGLTPGQEKWLLDLVALSTICDIVPLVGQNRILAKYGLLVLSKTKRIGLEALANVASINLANVTAYDVGFLLGPRLNASGRMEHARKSLDLLLSKNKSEAIKIAAELNKINSERQKLCERIIKEAKAEIESSDKKNHEIFLLSNENWPRGVVGIIASKIADTYSRPVIVFEHNREGYHGSARSIDALDITDALAECEDCLLKFGGHAKAAGVSVSNEKWVAFNDKLLEIVRGKIKTEDLVPKVTIDAKMAIEDVNDETLELIEKLEPFGFGNKAPVFVSEGVTVTNVKRVGPNKEHLKFGLKIKNDKSQKLSAISFSDPTPLKEGNKIDIVYTLRYNIWNQRKTIDLRIIDIKLV